MNDAPKHAQTMGELHEVVFEWPRTEPSSVIVTGTFDQWSSSLHLEKGHDGFSGKTFIEYGQKITYKFVVDGDWKVDDSLPTEADGAGNINNVYTAPERPVKATENGEPVKQNGDRKEVDTSRFSLTDLAATIVAAEGTSSALEYVTSSVGGAIKGVIGVDPWSPVKLEFESPREPGYFQLEEPLKTETISELGQVSPIVPIPIVPVNAPENNDPVPPTKAEVSAATEEPSTHTPIPPTSPAAEETIPPPNNLTSSPSAAAQVEHREEEEVASPAAPPPESVNPIPSETTSIPEEKAATSTSPQTNGVVAVEPAVVSDGVKALEQDQPPEQDKTVKPLEEVKAAESEKEVKTTEPETQIKPSESDKEVKEPPKKAEALSEPPNEEKTTSASEQTPSGTPTSTAPSTPAKKQHLFPSSESPGTATDSPPSAYSTRKKKGSIFRRISIKGIFGSDKDKEKK